MTAVKGLDQTTADLATVIFEAWRLLGPNATPQNASGELAEAVLAAGWRPPLPAPRVFFPGDTVPAGTWVMNDSRTNTRSLVGNPDHDWQVIAAHRRDESMTTSPVSATGPRDRSPRLLARSTAAAVCVVRGCTRAVYTGHACPECVTELGAQLRELDEYWDVLGFMVEPVRAGPGRGSPGYGSRPPLRLDVLAALDPSTLPTPEDDVWSIPGTIRRLGEWIATERGEERKPGVWYVLTQLQWAAGHEGFGDVADAITELHRRAQGLAHDRPETSLGDCMALGCTGQVVPAGAGGRCGECDRPYVGFGLLKLQQVQEAAA